MVLGPCASEGAKVTPFGFKYVPLDRVDNCLCTLATCCPVVFRFLTTRLFWIFMTIMSSRTWDQEGALQNYVTPAAP
jgi:hypothetical protein